MFKIGSKKIVFLCLFIVCIYTITNAFALSRLKLGDKIYSFTLKTTTGEEVNINKFIGKENIALIFWKIPEEKDFIDYSLNEIKFMEEYQNKYKNSGLKIIAIYCPWGDNGISEKELNGIKEAVKKANVTFPILLDSGLNIYNKYGVCALPTFILTNKKGIAKFILPGYPSHSAENILEKEIKNLLDEKQNS